MDKVAWRVFVLMPFRPELLPLFEEGIKCGVARANATAERVDEQKYDGTVMARVVGQIESADLVVAVLIENRPNVMYEVGLAHGLQKRVVLITDDASKIPFDLKDFPHILYSGSNSELADAVTSKVQWCREQPSARDTYCMTYRDALRQAESVDAGIFPFLVPFARRKFNEWSTSMRELVGAGTFTTGPDRLAITERIVSATRVLRIIDRFVADPGDMHSKDWLLFYDRIGKNVHIEKTWHLCMDIEHVRKNGSLVRACHSFYSARRFVTAYCQPVDLMESLGTSPPDRVIENYGSFVKLLTVSGSSFKKGDMPNQLLTTIRSCTASDEQLYRCIQECAVEMNESWLRTYCD